ncbi:MAG: hypothetical protein ACE5F9_05245 [Phycisphaerae bacterium]
MPDRDVEAMIAAVPLRQLSPDARRDIVARLVDADRTEAPSGRRRRVSFWRAVAACVVLCAGSYWAGRASTGTRRPTPVGLRARGIGPRIVVHVDPSFLRTRRPAGRLDLSRWQFIQGD